MKTKIINLILNGYQKIIIVRDIKATILDEELNVGYVKFNENYYAVDLETGLFYFYHKGLKKFRERYQESMKHNIKICKECGEYERKIKDFHKKLREVHFNKEYSVGKYLVKEYIMEGQEND